MQRLSPQDSSFLHLEDAVSHMHIGSVAILEGPPPSYEAVARMVRAHLPGVPRYRQKVHFVPIALGRPVWVDDPHFNLGYHLRRTALPPPGGDEELRNLVGRVMSQQLDRDKPLWEMWIDRGAQRGTVGIHHQAASLHGRRRLRDRALGGDSRLRARPRAPGPRRVASRAPAIGGGAGRPSARPTGGQSVRAAARHAIRRALAGPCGQDRRRDRSRHVGHVRCGRAAAAVVAQRTDRAAPPLGVGTLAALRRQAASAARSAARSTTSS